MKKVFSAAMVLIGTFIGAGFASGQEIMQYFGIYGKLGTLGILISCVLIGTFTYCTADNINFLGEREYVEQICTFRWVNWMINGYMILMFGTMITAFGECVYQVFGLPKIYGVVLIDVITMIILYFGADGVVKLNAIVTPLIIFGIIFAFFANNTVSVFSHNNFLTSSVIYTSYNVITLPFVMVGMKNMLSDRKKILGCSFVFSGTIFLLALSLMAILNSTNVYDVEIPLLSAVSENYLCIFVFVLAMAMLTTAVSNGYGFVNAVKLPKKISVVFIGIFAVLFSFFSFSFIVKYLYGLFGYMGLYILIKNLLIFLKNREKPRKI